MNARTFLLFSFLFVARIARADSASENIRSDARYPVISHIPREKVGSSVIASIGYSKRRHILEIEFVNGAVYRYLTVTPSVYRDLMTADSNARYYVENIRRKYTSVRVRP